MHHITAIIITWPKKKKHWKKSNTKHTKEEDQKQKQKIQALRTHTSHITFISNSASNVDFIISLLFQRIRRIYVNFCGIFLTQSVSYILSLALILFSLARVQIISDRFFSFLSSSIFALPLRINWVCECVCLYFFFFIQNLWAFHFETFSVILWFLFSIASTATSTTTIALATTSAAAAAAEEESITVFFNIQYALFILDENTNYHIRHNKKWRRIHTLFIDPYITYTVDIIARARFFLAYCDMHSYIKALWQIYGHSLILWSFGFMKIVPNVQKLVGIICAVSICFMTTYFNFRHKLLNFQWVNIMQFVCHNRVCECKKAVTSFLTYT